MSHSESEPEASGLGLSRKSSAVSYEKKSGGKATATSNARKRSSLEPVDYPRRRATIACEVCRSRKSRCDGARPKCRLCTELSADCVYREPGVKLDAGDKLILERLSRIESLLQSNTITDRRSVTSSPADLPSPNDDSNLATTRTSSAHTGYGSFSFASPTNSNVPSRNSASTLELLQWPRIRDLASRKCDPQTLVQLEMQREPISPSRPRSLDFANAEVFIQSFFTIPNQWYACVSPYQWHKHYRVAHAKNFMEGPESCLVLLVMALGAASYHGSISRLIEGVEPVGLPFFACAWSMLPSLITRTDMISCQCLFLTCAYLIYLVRPLEAWNLLSSLSKKLQLLTNNPISITEKRISERLCWNVALLESDLQMELELPSQSLTRPEDIPSLPRHFEGDHESPVAQDDLDFFLAQIDLKSILNRICSTLYTARLSITDVLALRPIIEDLDIQLTRWYEELPHNVKFDLHTGRTPHATTAQIVLRLRYFACRTMLYRPYVLSALIDESALQSGTIKAGCRHCLEACIRQLENMTAHHAGHLAYLWQGALSIVSQTLLVMGSTLSSSLSELLPPPHQMNAIIDDAVRELERYSQLSPSLKLVTEIVREADKRRRAALMNSITTSRILLH